MKNLNKLGVHVFEKTKDIPYETDLLAMNLLSCLTWKLYHGPIILYCNSEYKKLLEDWGLDKLYDRINTDLLDNKPEDINYVKYWAFAKLLVIEDLQNSTPFTLFDNDLWFTNYLNFDDESDLIVYHKEEFSMDYHNNIYVDFDLMIPDRLKKMNFDKSVLPTNAAILHFNTKYFIQEWVDLSKEVAKFNEDKTYRHSSTQMCFVEQRLLPMLLHKRNYKYSTFIDHVYVTHKAEPQDGSEWFPHLNDSEGIIMEKFESIKHVWGLKKNFHIDEIRGLVLYNMIRTLQNFNFDGTPYKKIVDILIEEYNSLKPVSSF